MLNYVIDHMDHDFTVFQSFKPEALHFTMNDEDISTCEYQISSNALDLDGDPVIVGTDFISPKNTHWMLRYQDTEIMGGIHTSVAMSYGQNYMSVTGSDWMWYLDQRFLRFDGRPDHAHDNVIGSPAEGFSYEIINVHIEDALTAIFDQVFGADNSMPITYSGLSTTDWTIDYYRLDLSDTTTVLDIVKDLCSYTPGVAFKVNTDKEFSISDGPRWYGLPEDIADGDSSNAALIWVVSDAKPPLSLDFTNTGPACTHVQAQGDGTTTNNVVTYGNEENQEVYWRLDKSYNFTDAITRDTVEAKTHEQFAFDLNPIHEIPLSLDPDTVDKQYSATIFGHDPGDDDGFFWQTFQPGQAIWIDLNLIAHSINSPHHIVSMDCTVGTNGSTTVSISQNQIYDTTGQAHTEEA